jgi:hypothetical protein
MTFVSGWSIIHGSERLLHFSVHVLPKGRGCCIPMFVSLRNCRPVAAREWRFIRAYGTLPSLCEYATYDNVIVVDLCMRVVDHRTSRPAG